MRVFVTGATGFVGMAVVEDLIAAGHHVLGLCRSPEKAAALAATGAEVHRGSVEDLDDLAAAAAGSDGVIHLAFNHDFSQHAAHCEDDRRVITTLGSALAGSGRPLIVTSGIGMADTRQGQIATEDDAPAGSAKVSRAASEEAATALREDGINVSVVRLPQVHDTRKQGLITFAVEIARKTGTSAYIGDGANRFPAAHVGDTARLYRLAIERAESGALYHAVAEEGVRMKDIAEAIGRSLNIPVAALTPDEAEPHFGWLTPLLARDIPASSHKTRQVLGWQPTGPGLVADLERLEVSG